jgi:hypothetical protein
MGAKGGYIDRALADLTGGWTTVQSLAADKIKADLESGYSIYHINLITLNLGNCG